MKIKKNDASSGSKPMKNKYLEKINELKLTMPEWDNETFFNDHIKTSKNKKKRKVTADENDSDAVSRMMTRESNWIRLEVLGEPLSDKFAWAIPDERALNILAHFSPLIEIGAGKGYWARLLQSRGIDIVAFDKEPISQGPGEKIKSWAEVNKGGPKLLSKPKYADHSLFLCYPDEGESMSIECLEHFTGSYIIHVGELLGAGGTISGAPQAPFGRTTSAEFTVALAESFHCLLKASIPRFPFSNDCISVWKRTNWVQGRMFNENEGDSEEGEDSEAEGKAVSKSKDKSRIENKSIEHEVAEEVDNGKDNYEDGDDKGSCIGSVAKEENLWADIPASERLPSDSAAPCLEHLLH